MCVFCAKFFGRSSVEQKSLKTVKSSEIVSTKLEEQNASYKLVRLVIVCPLKGPRKLPDRRIVGLCQRRKSVVIIVQHGRTQDEVVVELSFVIQNRISFLPESRKWSSSEHSKKTPWPWLDPESRTKPATSNRREEG